MPAAMATRATGTTLLLWYCYCCSTVRILHHVYVEVRYTRAGVLGSKKGRKNKASPTQPNPAGTQCCAAIYPGWYTWYCIPVLLLFQYGVLFFNVMERLSAQSGVLTTRPRFSPFRVPSRGLLGDCCVRQELKSAVSPGLFAYIPEDIFNIIIFYFPAQLVPYHTCHFCVMFLAGGLTVGGLLRGYSFPTRCRTTNLNERIIRTTKTMHAALVPCILSSRSFSYFLPPHPPLPPPAPPNLKGAMA